VLPAVVGEAVSRLDSSDLSARAVATVGRYASVRVPEMLDLRKIFTELDFTGLRVCCSLVQLLTHPVI
jgi:hypothetical protein